MTNPITTWFRASCLLALAASATACSASPTTDDVTADRSQLTANDAARYRWVRFARAEVAPRLLRLGVPDIHVRRAVWFGLSEGIFTIASNGSYGRRGGAQSPVGFSNCGDATSVNRRTALPDCFGAEGFAFRSGNWQVGLAGAQVSDAFGSLPRLYRDLYGDLRPKDLARDVMTWLGEDPSAFPDRTIESLTCQGDPSLACKTGNAKWVSVILRDPTLNVYVQTQNGWIRDLSRDLGFGRSIVDEVWAEANARPTARAFPETGQRVDGLVGQYWHDGNGTFACWPQNVEPCIAAYGYPIEPEVTLDLPIPGSTGRTIGAQRFERTLVHVNRYAEGTRTEGALLGGQGRPEVGVDEVFAGYYARYGGLAAFGYPTGPATQEGGRRTQTFERARLEAGGTFDPNGVDPIWQVARGLLGRER